MEEQSLTFSEALWLKTNQLDATALATAGTDGGASPGHRATMYDDTTGEHHFLFVELRNASAFGVPLADTTQSTTADKGLWRIRRAESSAGQNETVVFQSGAPTIAAGGQRVVATTDVNATMGNSKRRPAEFRVNYDTFNMPATDDTYELIAPNTGIGSNPAKMNDNLAPKSSVIDLMYDDHETWFELGDSG